MRSLLSVIVFVVLCILWLAVAHASPSLDLGEPQAPPVRVVVEDGDSPLYYRLPPDTVSLASRTAFGAAIRDGDGAFALSTMVGASIQLGRGSHAGVWTEAGYSYERFHEHLLMVGAGPSVRGLGPKLLFDEGVLGFHLVPHAVIARVDGATGYGIRTSAIASFWFYGIELAHQMLVVGSQRTQEIQVSLTFPLVLR
jgi:hypothetical protein